MFVEITLVNSLVNILCGAYRAIFTNNAHLLCIYYRIYYREFIRLVVKNKQRIYFICN